MHGAFSIGRSRCNRLMINESHVCRRHVLVHEQEGGEWWVVDQGSRCGTILNGRPLAYPARLSDGDELTIGDQTFTFHAGRSVGSGGRLGDRASDRSEAVESRWLMVACLRASDEEPGIRIGDSGGEMLIARRIGKWLNDTSFVMDAHQGDVHRYSDRGWWGGWNLRRLEADLVAECLVALEELRASAEVPFHLVVDLATMAGWKGGGFFDGMGKLAEDLACERLFSGAAHAWLQGALELRSKGWHQVAGRADVHEFFG